MTARTRVSVVKGRFSRFAAAFLLAGAGACGDRGDRIPEAEFIVAAGDSTFWVSSDGSSIRLRGTPMVLARLDGRFRELYVVDEDRSFENALFVGQRLYMRDIATNDSIELFRDTLVASRADAYEREHPEARRLAPDEDTGEEPSTTATAEVGVLGVHGPFLSVEYHADTTGEGDESWHMTRHMVIDMRTARPATLTDVLGAEEASAVLGRARNLYRETVDSVRRDRRPTARRAAQAIARFRFDSTSFWLTAPNGTLMVAFSAPGQGSGGAGGVMPMRPIPVNEPQWWRESRINFPTSTGEREERWQRSGYVVKAMYDTSARPVMLTLTDSAGREHQLGAVTAPVHRIYWIDGGRGLDRAQRDALTKAFEEAALYEDAPRASAPTAEGILPVKSEERAARMPMARRQS